MRNQEWDPALAQLHPLDLAQLVLCLLLGDAVHGEAALGVVDEAEVLARLLDGDDVHVAGWVGGVGAHFAVDFDEALHHDRLGLAGVEGVFEAVITSNISILYCTSPKLNRISIPVADEDDQGHAVAQLVRTGAGLGRISTTELVEQPVRWSGQPLLMLLWSSTHGCGGVCRSSDGVVQKVHGSTLGEISSVDAWHDALMPQA